MTQLDQVVSHVKTYGHITVLEAMALYKITQLGRVIYDLKDTQSAMKAIPCPELGKGFVRYVPDFDQRLTNLVARSVNDIEDKTLTFPKRRKAIRALHFEAMEIANDRNNYYECIEYSYFPECPKVSLTVADAA